MEKYMSHKAVEAEPIVAAEFNKDGSGKVYTANKGSPNNRILWTVPAGFKCPNTSPTMRVDGGDYLICHEDGYLSWLPGAVFEAGYVEVMEADTPKPLPVAGVFRKKKPVEVEAFQMTRQRRIDNSDWPEWMHDAWNKNAGEKGSVYSSQYANSDGARQVIVGTLVGKVLVEWGDYIVREPSGELYPCDAATFAAEYEAV